MLKSGIINKRTAFGQQVNAWLNDIGRTQKWLAQQLGFQAATLSYLLRGVRDDPEKIELINSFIRQHSA
jgi:hypothetical protein